MTDAPPELSIVIPAYNEEKLLPATLAAIRAAASALDAAGVAHEIIVCDNNSTDRTPEIARAAGASVVFEPVNQIGRARNAGAAAARGAWLLFIDADSTPPAGLFAEVAALLRRDDVMLAGATVVLDAAPFSARCVAAGWNGVSRLLGLVAGSFILVRTEAFREVGGFSLAIYAGEELDLARRLKKLARARRQRTVILHRHPLITSARKVTLYRPIELLRFAFRAVLRPRRTMGSREACAPWYDGRR